MIIVEGADNVGKTTLIRQLVGLDPTLRIIHRERFKPERGESIATSYMDMLFPTPAERFEVHAHSIIDRFLVSECIYGRLFRGACRITSREHIMIKSVLALYNPLVIWCNPPDAEIKRTWSERGQLYDEPLKIAYAYREYINELFDPLIVHEYDWTKPNAEQLRESFAGLHSKTSMVIEFPSTLSHCKSL